MKKTRANRYAAATIVVAALLGAATSPAHAINPGPLLKDAARTLPKVPHQKFQLPNNLDLKPLGKTEYGISDQVSIGTLDRAKASEVSTVDSTVKEVTNSSESEDLAKECTKEAFKKAAEDFFQAAQEGTAYPSFNDTFYYAVHGCLTTKFPGAPETVDLVASNLTGHADQSAQQAASTEPSAFANWLSSTGDELAPRPVMQTTTPPYRPPQTGGESNGGFPWWVLIPVAVLVVVLIRLGKRG